MRKCGIVESRAKAIKEIEVNFEEFIFQDAEGIFFILKAKMERGKMGLDLGDNLYIGHNSQLLIFTCFINIFG